MELLELLPLVSSLFLPLSQSPSSCLSHSLSLRVKDKLKYIFMKLELLFSFLFSIQAKFKCFIFLFFRKHFHFSNKLSSGRLNFMSSHIPFQYNIIALFHHHFNVLLTYRISFFSSPLFTMSFTICPWLSERFRGYSVTRHFWFLLEFLISRLNGVPGIPGFLWRLRIASRKLRIHTNGISWWKMPHFNGPSLNSKTPNICWIYDCHMYTSYSYIQRLSENSVAYAITSSLWYVLSRIQLDGSWKSNEVWHVPGPGPNTVKLRKINNKKRGKYVFPNVCNIIIEIVCVSNK